MNETTKQIDGKPGEKPAWLEIVRRQVRSLQFGALQIVVHDSQVTQIEKIERVRMDKAHNFSRPETPEA